MSGLPQSYGVPFPSAGGRDAYPPSASTYAASALPQQQQQVSIQPGSITYTTSSLPDGRIQYNQFRAEARSYQTPQGPVHGIQWIPVNVSYELPQNANPAGPDFHAAWSRPGGSDKETQKMLKEWQRDQEKRARKEEKESAKRMKEWERDRREREKAEEKELRHAQERDMQHERGRERKLSNAGMGMGMGMGSEYSTYSTAGSASYNRARSRSRVRRQSAGQDELTRAMAEMAMDKEWGMSEGEGKYRERRGSNVGRPHKVSMGEQYRGIPVANEYERTRRLSGTPFVNDYERVRKTSGTPYERTRKTSGTPYPTSGYPSAGGGAYPNYRGPSPRPGQDSYSGRTSPYMGGGGLPSAAAGGPVYPPGHIYAGKPIPGMQGGNLGNVSGSYGGPPSPRRSPAPLDSPTGFSRPPSLAVPYTFFDPLLILADMDDLFQRLPVMPAALGPHDVWVEDWIRCLEDMARAWTGQMPVRERERQRNLKNHTLVAQLIDVWNASFFSLRGVELVLYRGRRRYSGPNTGRYDRMGLEGSSDEESDTISTVSSDSDADERYAFYGGGGSGHAHHGTNHWLADSREARHLRKAEKKRLHEKKRKRRERERERERGSGFRLFLMCMNEGQPRMPPNSSGYAPPMSEGQPRMSSNTAGYPPSMSGYPPGY